MIEIEQVSKKFGAIAAVSDLSFTATRGEVLGFLGPNGAGKSTTMKMVAGFLRADSGRIRVCGQDVQTRTRAAQSQIGYLPEGAPAYGDMTVRGFLCFIADVRGLRTNRKPRMDAVIEQTGLITVLERKIETLSKGFRRRVGLAQAILHDPAVLILDEPTDGLDPNQKHTVRSLIRAMAADKTIIVSTHILEEVEAICNRAVIIDRGHVVADGTPGELIARSRYRNAVTLVTNADAAARIEASLHGLEKVAGLERTCRQDGLVHITAFAKAGALLVESIGALAMRENWPLHSMTAEAGRLDEVFRAITTHDGDAL